MQFLFVGLKQHLVPSWTSKSLFGLLINVCLFKAVSHFALMEREGVTHESNVGILSCTSGILLCTLFKWTKWPSVSVCWQPLVHQKIWLPIFVDKDWLNSTNTTQSCQATCHEKALLKSSTLFATQPFFKIVLRIWPHGLFHIFLHITHHWFGTAQLPNRHVSDVSNQNTEEAVLTLPGATPEE